MQKTNPSLPSVALIGPIAPPAGGMANQTAQLARLLAEQGMRVEIVPVNPPYSPAWVGKLRGVRALARLLAYLPRLWRAAGEFDVFHVMANSGWAWDLFAMPAIMIAHWRGTPVLVNYRGGEAAGFLRHAHGRVHRVLRHAKALVVPSGFLVEVFSRYQIGAQIIPNIVNTQRFYPDAARTDCAPNPHIVICRNLEAIYGIDIALQAFAQVLKTYPQAKISIAGSGELANQLKALARELGISNQVSFLGRLEAEQIAALYRQADVMLNASRIDNMPNSVLEAWACGVPVVSTNVGGVPFMAVHEKTALLVPPDQPDAMAQAILRLLDEHELWRSLREHGLQEAEQFIWDNVKKRWLELYQSIC